MRQLVHQQAKSDRALGHEGQYIAAMQQHSARVRAKLERVRPISEDAAVLEVGSGAHGLIFYFGLPRSFGIDPLAAEYVKLFPAWQRRVQTVAAIGEALPFPQSSFDVVLCDNVVDHAEYPARIVREIVRILAPGGLLYFTVNIHHPIYNVASRVHSAWNAIGLHFEIGPFADHTTHFTLHGARALFTDMPLQAISEHHHISGALARDRAQPRRHPGDYLKRVFFKNALFEFIAIREPGA